ncbi:hypothetical protein DFP72DRAFT_859384 [Ephemerocybe angulata]|uniref:Uncharacterized protein n=1 Tax=Ephemerocybe angulata TaxID=980116 RepID=A0A8H6HA50_9AGAR|nr:hypothetical protein DFP72DRAFT_859384 [Tulosesus angulatus]
MQNQHEVCEEEGKGDYGHATITAEVSTHGIFGFEKPGWGAVLMQRTGSNGMAIIATGGKRERGRPCVGILQRDKPFKWAKDTEEEIQERKDEEAQCIQTAEAAPPVVRPMVITTIVANLLLIPGPTPDLLSPRFRLTTIHVVPSNNSNDVKRSHHCILAATV